MPQLIPIVEGCHELAKGRESVHRLSEIIKQSRVHSMDSKGLSARGIVGHYAFPASQVALEQI